MSDRQSTDRLESWKEIAAFLRRSVRTGWPLPATLVAVLAGTACVVPPVGVVPAGDPGAAGPCTFERTDLLNEQRIALDVVKRHTTMSKFLNSVLGLDPETADDEPK